MQNRNSLLNTRSLLAVLFATLLFYSITYADASSMQVVPQVGHSWWVTEVAIDPAGTYAATGDMNGQLIMWELASGRMLWAAPGPPQLGVTSITFSPTGQQIAIGYGSSWTPGREPQARLYSNSGELVKDLPTGEDVCGVLCSIRKLRFSPDGQQLAGIIGESSGGGGILVWDTKKGTLIYDLAAKSEFGSAATTYPNTANIYAGKSFSASSIAFDPTSNRAYVLTDLNRLLLISTENWEIEQSLEIPDDDVDSFEDAIISSNGTYLILTSSISPSHQTFKMAGITDGIAIYELQTGRHLRSLTTPEPISRAEVALDGEFMAIAQQFSGDIVLYNIPSLQEISRINSDTVSTIALSPDGRYLLESGGGEFYTMVSDAESYGRRWFGGDFSADLWNVSERRSIRKLKSQTGRVNSLAWSSSDRLLVSGGVDKMVRVWRTSPPQLYRSFPVSEEIIRSVALSPDERLVAAGTADGVARIWNMASGDVVAELSGDSTVVGNVTFDPSGRYLTAIHESGNRYRWNVEDGKLITSRTVPSFQESGSDNVVYSNQGRVIASGEENGAIRIEDVETGEVILNLYGIGEKEWVALAPDNYYSSSPEGDQLLVFRDGDELYDVAQFRNAYYRPDIIRERTEPYLGASESEQSRNAPAIAVADNVTATGLRIASLSPKSGLETRNSTITLQAEAVDNELPIRAIHIAVNGSRIDNSRNSAGAAAEDKTLSVRRTVPLLPGENYIEVWAENSSGFLSRVERLAVVRQTQEEKLPRAFVLAVGISDYSDDALDLVYSRRDAQSILSSLNAEKGTAFSDIIALPLFDGKVTKEELEKVFKKIQNEAQPEDIVIAFFAGHTSSDTQGRHHFLTYNSRPGAGAPTLPYSRLEEFWRGLKAQRRIMLLDSCFSGALAKGTEWYATEGEYASSLFGITRNTGVYILGAATSEDVALESFEWGHGAFTKALLEGLEGNAESFRDRNITVNELSAYSTGRVPDFTNGRQTPMVSAYGVTDLTVARKKGN